MLLQAPPPPPPIAFVDATAEVGMGARPEGRLALADLNGDGRPDLVLARRSVLLNTVDAAAPRGWRFVPVALTLPEMGATAVTAFADLDNDGRCDALVAREGEATDGGPAVVFCRGRGDGTFDAAVPVPGLAPAHAAALAVGDANGDGLPDFYRGNWYRTYGEALDAPPGDLMLQVAPATTPPTWVRAPLPEDAHAFDEEHDAGGRPTYGAMIARLGDPARPPVLAQLNYGRRWNRLYARGVDGAWADVAPAVGFDGDADRTGAYPAWLMERAKTDKRFPTEPEKPFRSNGNTFDMAVGDVDGDGLFDCFVVEITHAWAGPSADRSRFLLAERAATPIGVRFTTPPWANVDRLPAAGQPGDRNWNQGDLFAELADLDNDGRLDLVLASGDYPDPPPFDERLRVLRQRAEPGPDGRRFEDVTAMSGIDLRGAAQLAVGDLDLDGDVDIVCGQSFTRFTPEMVKAEGGTPHLRVLLNQAADRGAPGRTFVLHGDPSAGVARDAIGAVVRARIPATEGVPARTAVAQVAGPGGHSGKQGAMQVHVAGARSEADLELPPGVQATDLTRTHARPAGPPPAGAGDREPDSGKRP